MPYPGAAYILPTLPKPEMFKNCHAMCVEATGNLQHHCDDIWTEMCEAFRFLGYNRGTLEVITAEEYSILHVDKLSEAI